jgi:hypothetical protein
VKESRDEAEKGAGRSGRAAAGYGEKMRRPTKLERSGCFPAALGMFVGAVGMVLLALLILVLAGQR